MDFLSFTYYRVIRPFTELLSLQFKDSMQREVNNKAFIIIFFLCNIILEPATPSWHCIYRVEYQHPSL